MAAALSYTSFGNFSGAPPTSTGEGSSALLPTQQPQTANTQQLNEADALLYSDLINSLPPSSQSVDGSSDLNLFGCSASAPGPALELPLAAGWSLSQQQPNSTDRTSNTPKPQLEHSIDAPISRSSSSSAKVSPDALGPSISTAERLSAVAVDSAEPSASATLTGKPRRAKRWTVEEFAQLAELMGDDDPRTLTGADWEALGRQIGEGRPGAGAKAKWDRLTKEKQLNRNKEGRWVHPASAKRNSKPEKNNASARVKQEDDIDVDSPSAVGQHEEGLNVDRDEKVQLVECTKTASPTPAAASTVAGSSQLESSGVPSRSHQPSAQSLRERQKEFLARLPSISIEPNTESDAPWSVDEECLLIATVVMWTDADWDLVASKMETNRTARECKRQFERATNSQVGPKAARMLGGAAEGGMLGEGKWVFSLNTPLEQLIKEDAEPSKAQPAPVVDQTSAPPAPSPPLSTTFASNVKLGPAINSANSGGSPNLASVYPTPQSQHAPLHSPPPNYSAIVKDDVESVRGQSSNSAAELRGLDGPPLGIAHQGHNPSWTNPPNNSRTVYHTSTTSGTSNYSHGGMSAQPQPRMAEWPATDAPQSWEQNQPSQQNKLQNMFGQRLAQPQHPYSHQTQSAFPSSSLSGLRYSNALAPRGSIAGLSSNATHSQPPSRRSSGSAQVYPIANGQQQHPQAVYVPQHSASPHHSPVLASVGPPSHVQTQQQQLQQLIRDRPDLVQAAYQQQQTHEQQLLRYQQQQRQQHMARQVALIQQNLAQHSSNDLALPAIAGGWNANAATQRAHIQPSAPPHTNDNRNSPAIVASRQYDQYQMQTQTQSSTQQRPTQQPFATLESTLNPHDDQKRPRSAEDDEQQTERQQQKPKLDDDDDVDVDVDAEGEDEYSPSECESAGVPPTPLSANAQDEEKALVGGAEMSAVYSDGGRRYPARTCTQNVNYSLPRGYK